MRLGLPYIAQNPSGHNRPFIAELQAALAAQRTRLASLERAAHRR
jgi:hypothetical protein